ncbi:hypothetical protein OIO90_004800, partial [Microbotryomycetes sp. JL221]
MSEGLKVALHPLPVLNMSEHLTRVSLQQRDPNVKVVGALLGTQLGRDIEIMNTFELVINTDDNDDTLTLDDHYFATRADQFKQVFPAFDFLGWYTIGDEPSTQDIHLHKQASLTRSPPLSLAMIFFKYNETPLFAQLSRNNNNTTHSSTNDNKDVPIILYESIIEIKDNQPQVVFVETSYQIETGEAERVAVDHVAKTSSTESTGIESSMIANLTTQRNAIQMLSDRVKTIVEYLQALSKGSVERDEETLRMIASLCSSLPSTSSIEFTQEFMT